MCKGEAKLEEKKDSADSDSDIPRDFIYLLKICCEHLLEEKIRLTLTDTFTQPFFF